MKARIVAIAIAAIALAAGLIPNAGASSLTPTTGEDRVACAGVRTLDIGICLQNPLP